MQRRTAFQFDCQEPEGISATILNWSHDSGIAGSFASTHGQGNFLKVKLVANREVLVAEFTLDDSVNVVCETTGPLAGEAQS